MSRAPRSENGRRPLGRRAAWIMAPLLLAAAVAGYVRNAGSRGEPQEVGPTAPSDPGRTVRFRGAGNLLLTGELMLPAGKSSALPAVVIVPGFPPANRDGIAVPGSMPDPFYRDLATALADAGIASLRYDRRGSGQSPLPPDKLLAFEDLVGDARAGLQFLRERREIDPGRTSVAGHTEGGLVALRVAAEDGNLRALLLVSTPGRPLVDVLADDVGNAPGRGARGPELAERFRQAAADYLASGSMPEQESLPHELRPIFSPDQAVYLRTLLALDPAAEAPRVAAPVMVVGGTLSNRIPAADAARLAGALGERAELLVAEGRSETLGLPNFATLPPPPSGNYDLSHVATVMGPGGASVDRRDVELLRRLAAWLGSRMVPA